MAIQNEANRQMMKKRKQKLCQLNQIGGTIRVSKVPFHVFDKLKNEIQKFIIKFCFYHNMKNEIQIIDYYFHVKIDLCFEFLMLSFVFHFHKKWKTKHSWFFVFHFHEGIEK